MIFVLRATSLISTSRPATGQSPVFSIPLFSPRHAPGLNFSTAPISKFGSEKTATDSTKDDAAAHPLWRDPEIGGNQKRVDYIKTWVEDYCSFYYKTDEAIQKDSELQSWWKELREEGHGDKKHESWWPKMQTRQELIDSCTIIIWIASALHAA